MSIPVIDLFAGPGGLGEGFARHDRNAFDIVVSIEKDAMAHDTLRLRAAYRHLRRNHARRASIWSRWDAVVESTPWNVLFHTLRDNTNAAIREACLASEKEALCLELGPDQRDGAANAIRERLLAHAKGRSTPSNSVLIGGPPCQAYSIVGRSRNRGNSEYRAESDHRHFLYIEYLHVISRFRPAIFVMENVKGILTSKVKDRHIFHTILQDLKRPDLATGSGEAVEYVLLPLSSEGRTTAVPKPQDFLLCAEDFGVPQARHRVIILGVRKDVFDRAGSVDCLKPSKPPTVGTALHGLPPLRPQLSHRGGRVNWLSALNHPLFDLAMEELERSDGMACRNIARRMAATRSRLERRQSDPGCGRDRWRLEEAVSPVASDLSLREWYHDRRSPLLTNHESRAHMPTDLVRYLFLAAYAAETGNSPKLSAFPRCLLPQHKNVDPDNPDKSPFKDRFRVQVGNSHSMTITSHIAKDGHAFVHPDPVQCRSLTVREAARLQTFPDSYVFLGSRTSQYVQVGNAVPPYLASQIAKVVFRTLAKAGMA